MRQSPLPPQPAQDYRASIAEYIAREARPLEKYGHQPRLYATARLVGVGNTYDDDIVYAAAWLHDLGVFTGHRPEGEALAGWDNTAYAMERAPELLRRFCFPPEKISAVVEAIRTHQPQARPTTLEGRILREADILEQLGSIGILRTVCKVGRDTRYPTFTHVVAILRKALAELPAQLTLDTAQRLAQPKIAVLRCFLEGVESECLGALH